MVWEYISDPDVDDLDKFLEGWGIPATGYVMPCFYSYRKPISKYLRKFTDKTREYRIFEFGTGRSTKQIADYFIKNNIQFTIHTFENWVGYANALKFNISNIVIHPIASQTVEEIYTCIKTIGWENNVDFAFIDMDMAGIMDVRAKILAFMKGYVKKDGYVVFHDIERQIPAHFAGWKIIDHHNTDWEGSWRPHVETYVLVQP